MRVPASGHHGGSKDAKSRAGSSKSKTRWQQKNDAGSSKIQNGGSKNIQNSASFSKKKKRRLKQKFVRISAPGRHGCSSCQHPQAAAVAGSTTPPLADSHPLRISASSFVLLRGRSLATHLFRRRRAVYLEVDHRRERTWGKNGCVAGNARG